MLPNVTTDTLVHNSKSLLLSSLNDFILTGKHVLNFISEKSLTINALLDSICNDETKISTVCEESKAFVCDLQNAIEFIYKKRLNYGVLKDV